MAVKSVSLLNQLFFYCYIGNQGVWRQLPAGHIQVCCEKEPPLDRPKFDARRSKPAVLHHLASNVVSSWQFLLYPTMLNPDKIVLNPTCYPITTQYLFHFVLYRYRNSRDSLNPPQQVVSHGWSSVLQGELLKKLDAISRSLPHLGRHIQNIFSPENMFALKKCQVKSISWLCFFLYLPTHCKLMVDANQNYFQMIGLSRKFIAIMQI